MITTAEFKKQIAKPFGQEMRLHGFKGTGFEYKQETDDYLIAVYIDPSRWGGSCSAGFAIHPKLIDKDYDGKKDLAKLITNQYEFKFSFIPYARGEKWEYAYDEATNLGTLAKIVHTIKYKAFPVIERFTSTPNFLDKFEVSEMNKFHDYWTKRFGVSIATTDLRFAWAMTIIFENRNLEKAKQFANWALSLPENLNSDWFGNNDFHRVLKKNAA